jgi:hypothetical protein
MDQLSVIAGATDTPRGKRSDAVGAHVAEASECRGVRHGFSNSDVILSSHWMDDLRSGVRVMASIKNWITCGREFALAAVVLFFGSNFALADTIIKNADGSSVATKSDGTKIITNKDGSSVQTRADGTKIITNKDGSSVETHRDGTKITINADKSSVTDLPNGTEIIKNTDGSSEQDNPDGSKIITNADGTKVVQKAKK